jgi:hypothetical protein
MTSHPIRSFALRRLATLALATASLSLGCGAEVGDGSVGDDIASLSASGARSQWFDKHVQLYGETSYGSSTPAIPFNKGDKRYKAFSFLGQAGDKVSIRVWAPEKGDAQAWLVDDSYYILAFNDNESRTSKDARIDYTLKGGKGMRRFYIVWADKNRRDGAAFATDLQGPCGDTTNKCAPGQIVDPSSCSCVTPPPPPPQPVPVQIDRNLLIGSWQMTGVSDSSHDPQPQPDGPIYTFGADGSLRLDCTGNVNGKWDIDPNGYTINATLGISDPANTYTVQWIALKLDADNLNFYEGGDIFYFQHGACP